MEPAGELEQAQINIDKHTIILEAFKNASPRAIKEVPIPLEGNLSGGTLYSLIESSIGYRVWVKPGKHEMPSYTIEMIDLEKNYHMYITHNERLGDNILEAILNSKRANSFHAQ